MSTTKVNFTKKLIENLPPKEKQRTYYYDTQTKGLVLDVRPSGTKSFYIYKKIKSRPERIFLGTFPDMSVENARKKALNALSSIANGTNPQDEKRAVNNEYTLGSFFEEYMERYSKKHKKSWVYDEREIKKFLSHWFKRKISDIQKEEIRKLLEAIHDKNGLYQSNRILERIRAMYNKAIEWGWSGINPTLGIKKYKEKSRDRFILPNEMPSLLKALEEEANNTAKDYFWMLLLTGARRTNTLMMRWVDIAWEMDTWCIPSTKNGDPLTIPLVERAITILKARRRKTNSDWVFPNEEDTTKHLVNFKRAWKRVLQKATIYLWYQDEAYSKFINEDDLLVSGYQETNDVYKSILSVAKKGKITLPVGLMDLHIHDIRRTFGSYQAITGASLQIIGKSLGHKSQQSTQIYARLNLDPVRASVEKATIAMFSTVNSDNSGN